MSFQDYAQHIAQKYRLAVAIAVIKEKPPNLSIEQYLNEIRNKINNENSDTELTVCSDDFNIDYDSNNNFNDNDKSVNDTQNSQCSETILKNYNVDFMGSIQEAGRLDDLNDNLYTAENNINWIEKDIVPHSQYLGNEKEPTLSQNLDATFCPTPMINDAQELNFNNTNSHNEVLINAKDTYDTQKTILYSLHGFTQPYTHVSQSQYEDIVVPENWLRSNLRPFSIQNVKSIVHAGEVDKNNVPKTDKENAINEKGFNTNDLNENLNLDRNTNKRNENLNFDAMDLDINEMTHSTQNFSPINTFLNDNQNENNVAYVEKADKYILTNSYNKNELKEKGLNVYEELNFDGNMNTQNGNERINIDTMEVETNEMTQCNKNCGSINNFLNEDNELETSEEEELIPFKVIEELNKVKSYLNKKVERRISNDGSIDTGYRSDSQSRCSYKSSVQLSVSLLNQSAHSLFSYITHCPMLATTEMITNEIAQVLGQLIDRLHEEEKYPSFLDELLEHIGGLIQDIYGSDNSRENDILKKDEDIHRLFLLNKSRHIQKYTIEKLTEILEKAQANLSNKEEFYELKNIDETDNLSYIFHILEFILKRYMKNKNDSSQSLSNSQNELPKKSCITNIWRKKWNPNFKEINTQDNTPKTCVLVKCNEVLNKLVVSCMDGYSLVAFAALQCFNILQI